MQLDDSSFQKILVVDDEPDIVDEIVDLLSEEGLQCEGVNDPKKALERVAGDPEIGIIISDIRMPAMGGLELSRRLLQEQENDRDLHIILVTGHAGMAEAIEALKLGADDFLTKPLNSEQLLHSVRRSQEAAILRDKDRELKLRLKMEAESSAIEAATLHEELTRRNEELTEKNQELQEVNQLKDEFLGMISHELNTPLNSIIGFSHLLREMLENDGEERKSELTQHISEAANRLRNHISKIINIAKAQSGRLKIERQNFLIEDLYRNLKARFKEDISSGKGSIDIELDVPGIDFSADSSILGEAMACLVENALKFSKEGVEIKLTAEKTEQGIRLSVSDNGDGMDERTINVSLESLRQGDGKMTRRFEGMGLGLPLARQYVRLHDGLINIESTLGEGTTINIDLPDPGARNHG